MSVTAVVQGQVESVIGLGWTDLPHKLLQGRTWYLEAVSAQPNLPANP